MQDLDDMTIQDILEHSFKDFHVRGFDYICLKRTPEHTRKVYFFDGDVSKLPEVVNPHDHRYAFSTRVLAGAMMDYSFAPDPGGQVFQAFDYMTPLNGGNGFTYRGEERLKREERILLTKGDVLHTSAVHVHTIRMVKDQTVIMLDQFSDTVPLDAPTSCWVRKGDPAPDTSGLYNKFTADQIIDRLAMIKSLIAK